ncbi:hypothetical protein [Streptomyces tendae]|uniref:hypothetical protein n=1 Tax=Streptomyces tendae TaxID=1932 RepID=UPI0036C123DF
MALPLHRLQEGAHEFPHGRPGPVGSTATAPGTAWDGSAPTAAADSRASAGRTVLPPPDAAGRGAPSASHQHRWYPPRGSPRPCHRSIGCRTTESGPRRPARRKITAAAEIYDLTPADHHADLVRRPPRRGMRRGGRLRTVRQHGVVAINFSNEAMQSGQ